MGLTRGRILLSICVLTYLAVSASAAEDSALVRIYLNEKTASPIVGELVEETATNISVYDIKASKNRELTPQAIREIQRGISEESVSASLDLSRLVAWRIQKAIPLATAAGKIATVDLSTVYVNLGSNQGLEAGQELAVYRGSKEIRDPASNEVLDRVRRLIGKLKVVEVRDKISKCSHVGEYEVEYQVGDEVESSVKPAVAVFPFSDESGNLTPACNALTEDLTSGLVAAGVPLVERTRLTDALDELAIQQTSLFDKTSAQKIGRLVGGNAVVIGVLTENGKTFTANIRLTKVSTGEILFSHNRVIPASKIPRTASTTRTSSSRAVIASDAGGNLLNTPNLEQGVKKGNWQVQNGRLLFKGNTGDGVISFPHMLPKQLHLTLKATPAGVGPATCIALYFNASAAQFIVQLAQDGSCVIVDGKDPRGDRTAKYDPVFVDNRPNTIAYEVQGETLVVRVNGRRFLIFKDARLGKTASNEFALGVVGEWTFQMVHVDSK